MPAADIAIHSKQIVRPTMIDGVQVRGDVAFTNAKGEEKASIEKRGTQKLQKLSSALRRILRPDETVLYALSARLAPSAIEKVFSNVWRRLLGTYAIVITNSRLLFLPVKMNGTWRESIRAVDWGDLDQFTKGGKLFISSIHLRCRNGVKLAFQDIRGSDAKKLAVIASTMIPAAAGDQTSAHGVVQLCPDCLNILTPGQYLCPACGLMFKNEKAMVWHSIFLPGGGYFYTGHPAVGTVVSIIEVAFIADILRLLSAASTSHRLTPDLSQALIALVVMWVGETVITIMHCRRYIREFIPKKRDPMRTFQGTTFSRST